MTVTLFFAVANDDDSDEHNGNPCNVGLNSVQRGALSPPREGREGKRGKGGVKGNRGWEGCSENLREILHLFVALSS